MKGIVIAAVLVGALAVPAHATQPLSWADATEVEGCQVQNPAQPTCSYSASHAGESPVSGIAGVGSWVVKIKVGKKTQTIKSPATGAPTVVEMSIPSGATVTMEALAPGSGGTVGHVD
jgi:hypothetical protein